MWYLNVVDWLCWISLVNVSHQMFSLAPAVIIIQRWYFKTLCSLSVAQQYGITISPLSFFFKRSPLWITDVSPEGGREKKDPLKTNECLHNLSDETDHLKRHTYIILSWTEFLIILANSDMALSNILLADYQDQEICWGVRHAFIYSFYLLFLFPEGEVMIVLAYSEV